MTGKFTKGPWILDEMGMYIIAKDEAGEFPVCQIRGWGHFVGAGGLNLSPSEASAIQDANAMLVAASPDLYDALKAIVDQWDTPNWKLTESTSAFIENARAALRKARGE